jgi:hypothetical protein
VGAKEHTRPHQGRNHPPPAPVSGLKSPPTHTPATRVGNGYPSGHPHPPPTSRCYVDAPSLEVRHRWQTAGGDALAEVRAGRGDILAGFDRWEQRRPGQGVAQGERLAAWLRWGAGSGGGMAGARGPARGGAAPLAGLPGWGARSAEAMSGPLSRTGAV